MRYTYTIETVDNATRAVYDEETSLRAALATARQRRINSTGGGGSCYVIRWNDGATEVLSAWRETAQGWHRAS